MLEVCSPPLLDTFRLWTLSLAFGAFWIGVSAQEPRESVPISAGQSLVSETEGGKKTYFSFEAAAGQVVRGNVVQRGSDIIVRIVPDGGSWTVEFDAVIRPEGSEAFEFVSEDAGLYKIEIEGKRGTSKGFFELFVAVPESTAERDLKLHRARAHLAEAASLARAGKYKEAIKAAEETLAIREEVLGATHRETAVAVNRLGIYHFTSGNSSQSFEFTKRALSIYEKDPELDPLILAEVLNNMGVQLRVMGDFAGSERAYKRVIEIRERVFGPESLTLASTLNNLGLLYRGRGDQEAAETAYRRALQIREKHLGDSDLDLTTVLTNLAALSYYKGDYVTALSLDKRVLEIRQKHLPASHPSVAEAVYNVALLLNNVGDRENGERMLLQSSDLYEKAFGPDSLRLVKSLSSLGNFYRETGEFQKARGYLDRAVRIARPHREGNPLEYAGSLLYSARLRLLENDLTLAEQELSESLSIHERILGIEHLDVRDVLNTLAHLYALKRDLPRATETQARANLIGESQLAVNLIFGTEHQRLSFVTLLNSDLDQTLALQAHLGPDDIKVREMAATLLIQRKGRVLDAGVGSIASLRAHLKPEHASLLVQLNDTTAQLAALMVSGPRSGGLESFNARLAQLQLRKDEIDRELSRQSAGYYVPPKAYTLDDIRRVIPPNSALIEYALVRPVLATHTSSKPPNEYVAYVVRRDEGVAYVKLGDADKIDEAVASLRRALRDPRTSNVRRLAQKVDELVLRPVRTRLETSTHLLISPEGELNVVPFETLVDEQGHFAVERFQFTYLTSGRDLFRLGGRPGSLDPPIVVADPSFDGRDRLDYSVAGERKTATRSAVISVTSGRQLSDLRFAPLLGTSIEAENIRQVFPAAKVLTGRNATETSLRKVQAPEILHLATHGFFLEGSENRGSASQRGSSIARGSIENPLVRSGLAFAGANIRAPGVDDGLLTAMEASGLNLWGTKLTVLSACDTGIGEIRAGEGVYGLRRAFALAGSDALVMSMWPVSDLITRELMAGYYKNLKAGLGRGAALRKVQLSMMKKKGRSHPYYWAGFIHSGEWANLDGKR